MVFYDSWESFEKAAAAVYAGAAGKTRYTIKYRNCDAALVLKVTDDCTCVQMRTERLGDIKKVAHLHRMLAQATSNRSEPIKELAPIFPVSLAKSEGQAKNTASSEPAKQTPQTAAAAAQGKKKGRGRKRN